MPTGQSTYNYIILTPACQKVLLYSKAVVGLIGDESAVFLDGPEIPSACGGPEPHGPIRRIRLRSELGELGHTSFVIKQVAIFQSELPSLVLGDKDSEVIAYT